MTRHKEKITVLKVLAPEDIFGKDAPVNPETGEIHDKCPMHKVGQKFYVTHNYGKPCQ